MDAKGGQEGGEETRSTHVRIRESSFSRCWTMRATTSHDGIRLDERLRLRVSGEGRDETIRTRSSSTRACSFLHSFPRPFLLIRSSSIQNKVGLTPLPHLLHLFSLSFSHASYSFVVDSNLPELPELCESLADLCEVGSFDFDSRSSENNAFVLERSVLCCSSDVSIFESGEEGFAEDDLW